MRGGGVQGRETHEFARANLAPFIRERNDGLHEDRRPHDYDPVVGAQSR